MKKLFLLALLFSASFMRSQSDLVFNKVLLLKLSPYTAIVVPSGKTWKIEFISDDGSTVSNYSIILNGQTFISKNQNAIWVPELTPVLAGKSEYNYAPGINISVLEFNIVPK